MRYTSLLLLIPTLMCGCSVSGHYMSDGPCKGFHKDPEACVRAADNAKVISGVQLGQTTAQVYKIMGRYPLHRTASKGTQEWDYLTNYEGHGYTKLIFKDGVVTEIR